MKTIQIDGEIGWEVEARDIRRELDEAKEAGEKEVMIEISSPGGLISEGLKIYNDLKKFPGTVNTHLTGVVASMATYIAMAGERRTATKNSVFMIHNGRMLAIGDHRVMFKAGKHLDSLSNIIAKEYSEKTGKELAEIRQAMDDETFYYGEEIKEAGFVHDIIDDDSQAVGKAEAIAAAETLVQESLAKMAQPEVAKKDMEALAKMQLETEPEAKINSFDAKAKLKDEPWDKQESETRWRNHAGVKTKDDLPNDLYDKRFVYVGDSKSLTARSFPIWDYKGGEEFVNISAVRNGLARVAQSNLSERDKALVKGVLNKYLDKYKQQEKQEGKTMTYDELKKNEPELFNQILEEGRLAGLEQERARVKDLVEMRGKFTKQHSQAVIDAAIIEGHDIAKTNMMLMAAEQAAQELEDEKKNNTQTSGNDGDTDNVPEMKDGVMTHPEHAVAISKKIAEMVGIKTAS